MVDGHVPEVASVDRPPGALQRGLRRGGFSKTFFEASRDDASGANASSEEAPSEEAPLARRSSPCVALELDIALVNKWTAMLNIGMVVFVIVELVLVSALLTMVTTKLVVAPLERIFGNIKKNMDARCS